jgi:hypothetical protein
MRINLEGIKSGAVITRKTLAGRRQCQGSGGYLSAFYHVGSIKRRSVDAEFVAECDADRNFVCYLRQNFPANYDSIVAPYSFTSGVGTMGKLVVARNVYAYLNCMGWIKATENNVHWRVLRNAIVKYQI